MKEQIFILNKNQSLVELNEKGFVTEKQFQELLENYPKLISGSQINPDNPRKWILISREFGVPKYQTTHSQTVMGSLLERKTFMYEMTNNNNKKCDVSIYNH